MLFQLASIEKCLYNMNLDHIGKSVLQIIEATASFARNERKKWDAPQFRSKQDTSLVTAIDLATEAMLINGFKDVLPNSGFLAEENHQQKPDNEYLWIIDPIDGTTNMVHNMPMYCISVALQHHSKTVLGVIYEISSQECFYSWEGMDGVFLNGEAVKVSQAQNLQNSLLATGFPTVDLSRLDYYLSLLKKFIINTHGLRRLGSAAMDLAYVACGRCDGFYEHGLNPWDIAAGAYLVQKAGGQVSDFSGGDNYLYGREIIASNALIHKEFISYF
jgi:myo-inositol-1(or 4)-monophosphatase